MEEQFYLIHLIGMDPWGYLVVGDYTIFNGPVMCASMFTKSDLESNYILNYLEKINYELIEEDKSIYGHRRVYINDREYKFEYNTYNANANVNSLDHYYLIKILMKDYDTYLGTHYNQLQNCHIQFAKKFRIADLDSRSVKKFLNGFNYELIDVNLIPRRVARFLPFVDKEYRIRYRGSVESIIRNRNNSERYLYI